MPQCVKANVWSCFLSTGCIDRQPGQRRPRATTTSEVFFRHISLEETAWDLVSDLQAATGTQNSHFMAARGLTNLDCIPENQ